MFYYISIIIKIIKWEKSVNLNKKKDAICSKICEACVNIYIYVLHMLKYFQ